MDELFNMLSSSARIDKSKRRKRPPPPRPAGARASAKEVEKTSRGRRPPPPDADGGDASIDSDGGSGDEGSDESHDAEGAAPPRTKRPRKRHSAAKLDQIRREEVAAFRRRMGIRLSSDNRREVALGSMPDPISSFDDWVCPTWWGGGGGGAAGSDPPNNGGKKKGDVPRGGDDADELFRRIRATVVRNIERGRWKEPTPIQMQAVPSLTERRDLMGCAPTGSGKTGAFVLPAIAIAKCSEEIYYGRRAGGDGNGGDADGGRKGKKNKSKKNDADEGKRQRPDLRGQIRVVLLAPSRELASQLHREASRLSADVPGKFRCALLSKSNAGLAVSNRLGGKDGLDCLVATPLRLVECLEAGMKLQGVRLVVLDEADRLLDASDGRVGKGRKGEKESDSEESDGEGDSDDSSEDDEDGDDSSSPEPNNPNGKDSPKQQKHLQSGSSQSRTFLQQIDSILSALPASAARALFSATLGPSVRHLSESILRDPIDVRTGLHAGSGGDSAASGVSNTIKQELKFVGREEGKLLAIRQLVAEGLTPPVLIFLQSQERAQALFGELLYDGINVDVLHAGRSAAQREAAVRKFRRGETWVLICTDLVARGADFKGVNLVINYDLPAEGVTYVHRIGRTGRAGREGRAVTFFTEADFDGVRTIANVMRLSGCEIPEWMLTMRKRGRKNGDGAVPRRRGGIDTTPRGDRKRNRNTSRKKKK